MTCSPSRRFALTTIFLIAIAGTVRADNWPRWRGPDFDGISAEKGLPTEWAESKNIAWKLKLPGGASARFVA